MNKAAIPVAQRLIRSLSAVFGRDFTVARACPSLFIVDDLIWMI